MQSKDRRISITHGIILGIETMINSGCTNEKDRDYISSWIQDISRYKSKKYSQPPTELLGKLNALKNEYEISFAEKNGLTYNKNILDTLVFISKSNEKCAVEVENV